MYRFESGLEPKELEKRYMAIYTNARLQRKWEKEMVNCPELAQTLPVGINPVDMLTLKYEKLVEVYLKYRKIYSGLSAARQKVLKTAAEKVFKYSSYCGAIKTFLLNPDNGFEIYNCVYCDLNDVRPYGPNKRRQFDTEHILDKGECPLVGLSLYNFCPSCGHCNTNCKGKNPIGKNEAQMKKLGPTSKQYDFQHKVKFIMTEKPEAIGRIILDHPEWYEIDFDYNDDDYREVTKLFDLKDRYNLYEHKLAALEWRQRAMKNRGIAIRLAVWLHIRTEEQVRDEIFHLTQHREAHSPRLKLLEDMIGV